MQDNSNLKNVSMLKPWKQLMLFLAGFVGLIALTYLIQFLMSLISKSVCPTDYDYEMFINSNLASMILNGSAYLILGVYFIFMIKDESHEMFKSFKNWQGYVAAGIGFALIISFNMIYNSILSLANVGISDNANETSLNSMVTQFPLASLLIFAFIGPACEEITYRIGLFSLTRRVNRILAYIVTIVVFTLIHFDFFTKNMVNELLNIPFYAFAAFVFTFLYDRFGFASSLSAHITNNLLSIGATILTIIK